MLRIFVFFFVSLQSFIYGFNPFMYSTNAPVKRIPTNYYRSALVKGKKRAETKHDAVAEIYQGWSEAFVGGTVGVMSVMMMLEIKKKEDLGLESCPYCMGNGEILCATCCGCSVVMGNNGSCPTCAGRGLILCINCKGDGRITPILLLSKSIRNPEFAADKISIDSP